MVAARVQRQKKPQKNDKKEEMGENEKDVEKERRKIFLRAFDPLNLLFPLFFPKSERIRKTRGLILVVGHRRQMRLIQGIKTELRGKIMRKMVEG